MFSNICCGNLCSSFSKRSIICRNEKCSAWLTQKVEFARFWSANLWPQKFSVFRNSKINNFQFCRNSQSQIMKIWSLIGRWRSQIIIIWAQILKILSRNFWLWNDFSKETKCELSLRKCILICGNEFWKKYACFISSERFTHSKSSCSIPQYPLDSYAADPTLHAK